MRLFNLFQLPREIRDIIYDKMLIPDLEAKGFVSRSYEEMVTGQAPADNYWLGPIKIDKEVETVKGQQLK